MAHTARRHGPRVGGDDLPEPFSIHGLRGVFPGRWWTRPENMGYWQYDPHRADDPDRERFGGSIKDSREFSGQGMDGKTVVINEAGMVSEPAISKIGLYLLDYARRSGLSTTYKALHASEFETRKGAKFTLLTLGRKDADRMAYWRELYAEEPIRITEHLVAVEPERGGVIGSLLLTFANEPRDGGLGVVREVRLDGIGSAQCPVNSSFTISPEHRGMGHGPSIMALGIQRARDILGGRGVIGESIDSEYVGRLLKEIGFTHERPFGHGGTSIKAEDIRGSGLRLLDSITPRPIAQA